MSYTDNCEAEAISQITNLLNQEMAAGQQVRIMPDVHAGAGCTIGTTMTITDKVVPNLVGVDISCGMLVCKLGKIDIDLEKLDRVIRERVPSGFSIRSNIHTLAENLNLEALSCVEDVNLDRAYKSVGTLGGGNHFIELNKDNEGSLYLVMHSGSRHLGLEVAKHYQNAAYADLCMRDKTNRQAVINAKIAELKEQGRMSEIEAEIQKLKSIDVVPEDLAYCEGKLFADYIHDMAIVQGYAEANRAVMASEILFGMSINTDVEKFTTLHNYIDLENMILRKGAVSAQKGERLIIPMNMRDGSLICVGKGNPDWNYSAPHGAGRLMSRSKAKEMINLDEFQKSMDGIYTTCVCASTIDEAPMVYKPMEEIIANISNTVEIERIIKPVYNYKAN